MTSEIDLHASDAPEEPAEDGWFIDESVLEAPLTAATAERFEEDAAQPTAGRTIFYGLVALAVLLHAAIIAAFLYRDSHDTVRVTQSAETPVEIVVEKPPEPEKPKPPPEKKPEPPPPPRPKEDLSPSVSAPRAPSDTKVKTEAKEAKTAAPTQLETPAKGQPKATPANAPPKEAAPAETQKDLAAKEEDQSKPDAEALDKARRKAAKAKQSKTKEAKAASKQRRLPNALAALAGAPSLDTNLTIAKLTPKTKIYGGTDDVRWMSEVEAMLEAKVQQLPPSEHFQSGGKVAICFHVDVSGRVLLQEFCAKSGYPDLDRLAMRALQAAAPFPPPPPGLERGLVWVSTFDGQLPKLHFR
jgi:TonB family protein